jgi:predicted acetyltransferase
MSSLMDLRNAYMKEEEKWEAKEWAEEEKFRKAHPDADEKFEDWLYEELEKEKAKAPRQPKVCVKKAPVKKRNTVDPDGWVTVGTRKR